MIDINQMQIGDWILVTHSGKPRMVKVTFLDPSQIGYDIKDEVIVKSARAFNPIPLTKGLLEKNGFVVSRFNANKFHLKTDDERTHIWYYRSGGEPGVTMQIVKNEYYEDEVLYELPQPYYVHELQHALRLCGLNELADSFKV